MFDLVCLFLPLIKVIWIQSLAAALKLFLQSLSVSFLGFAKHCAANSEDLGWCSLLKLFQQFINYQILC